MLISHLAVPSKSLKIEMHFMFQDPRGESETHAGKHYG